MIAASPAAIAVVVPDAALLPAISILAPTTVVYVGGRHS
jgi:hypothetical protein